MGFVLVLLNPQCHTHLRFHEHDCFAKFSDVLLDCFDDSVVGFVFEIKLEQKGEVELDLHQEWKGLLNGGLERFFLRLHRFINKIRLLSGEISHESVFEFRSQFRNDNIREFVHLKYSGCYDGFGIVYKGFWGFTEVLRVGGLMEHKESRMCK